ncbi:MAG: NADH-quinone oxidoreductase subunit C [Acidimicrobiales bacterium]
MTDVDTPATAESVAPEPAPAPESLHGAPISERFGQRVAHPTREQLRDLVRTLRDEGWAQCLDVTAVDYLTHRQVDLPAGIAAERFEVVVILISHVERQRLRLRVQVPEADPVVPSLFEVHPGTEAMEREVFDMFGIRFDGHPDLSRILMPEDWHGHPLRKDYGVGRIPVQFKDAPPR